MNFVGLSIVQSVGPRKTGNPRVEIICLREGYSCMRMAGVIHSCMRMAVENPEKCLHLKISRNN